MRIYRDKEINEIVANLVALDALDALEAELSALHAVADAAQLVADIVLVEGRITENRQAFDALVTALAVVDGEQEPEQVKQVWWNADIHAA